MRLMQAMAGAPVGGAENFFTRLALAFARASVDQRVLIRPDAAREAALGGAGVAVAKAPFGGLLDLHTRARFQAEIGSFHPDIVLSWMNRASRFCPRGDAHGFVHVGTPRGYYKLKHYRRCDHLVCTTADLIDHFTAAGWPSGRITEIPNFAPEVAAEPVPRASLDTPDDVPLLLALGRLHVNKGFDTLLAALAELPDHYLWLGGSGPLKAGLGRQAGALGVAPRVRFLGWREDTPALLAAADAFVCSSRHEPFGNIIIEAWAAGVPVVAAASAGPAALIADGESGILVPVDDAPALAAAARSLATEAGLGERLAAGGRAAHQAGYTEEAVVRRYMELFERLAG